MDQQKIGTFLKQLRQERQLTQENLAEIMCVTNRSVSRWENGVNLPDLPILIQLADFYGVELRELLDGERKPDAMNTPETKSATEETARKVADYSNDVMEKITAGSTICTLPRSLQLLSTSSCTTLIFPVRPCCRPSRVPAWALDWAC